MFGRARRRPSVGSESRERRSEAFDEFTHKRVHGDHTFRFEFAERHVDCPLTWARRAKAVRGQIGALADAHAGVTNQQKRIPAEIIAAEKLLIQELILLRGEWTWKSVRETRNILAADQMSDFGKLLGRSQFLEDAAQRNSRLLQDAVASESVCSASKTSSRGCGDRGVIGQESCTRG